MDHGKCGAGISGPSSRLGEIQWFFGFPGLPIPAGREPCGFDKGRPRLIKNLPYRRQIISGNYQDVENLRVPYKSPDARSFMWLFKKVPVDLDTWVLWNSHKRMWNILLRWFDNLTESANQIDGFCQTVEIEHVFEEIFVKSPERSGISWFLAWSQVGDSPDNSWRHD